MHPRTRRALDAPPPESGVVAEFPPRAGDPDLVQTMSALRDERVRQGLSLSDIAKRTGIDRATLSKLETGKTPNPTVGTLRAVARALDKKILWSLVDEMAEPGCRSDTMTPTLWSHQY